MTPALALCMVVGPEDADPGPCLASARDTVDYWVICDATGGRRHERTVRAQLGGVPGELHRCDWLGAGPTRNELLAVARHTANHLLVLDPDLRVVRRESVPPLTDDAYWLADLATPGRTVRRLVRGDRLWWCSESTDGLDTNGSYHESAIDALATRSVGAAERARSRHLAAIASLKRDLTAGRAGPSAAFQIARHLHALGQRWAAIEWYRRRVELGGWEQEVFAANLQEGILRAEDDFASAVPVLLEAWERRPWRAEPLYELARGYRRQWNPDLAYLFANRGLAIAPPPDTLYVHDWVYAWGLRLERGWAAARLGHREEAMADLRAVLASEGVPAAWVAAARDWLINVATAKKPPAAAEGTPVALGRVVPELRIGELRLEVSPRWPTFNPSIAADGDGFRLVVRSANYEIGSEPAGGVTCNVNYLVELDADLAIASVRPLDDGPETLRRYPARVIGFEDCRLFQIDGEWYASATTSEFNPIDRQEIALLALDGPSVVSVRPLAGPNPGRMEKNWMPFLFDGELHYLYGCGPTVTLRCDRRTGRLALAAERAGPRGAEAYRGSSQGVPIGSGRTLFVVHELDQRTPQPIYRHRFVLLGPDLSLKSVSRPFTFTGERIEFCGGAARRGDELVLSFGVADSASYLAVLPMEAALELLEPVGSAEAD